MLACHFGWTMAIATVQPRLHGERGDLTARERREIEQHLADCARCRRHRVALEQALGALAVAANHLPVLSRPPRSGRCSSGGLRIATTRSSGAGRRWCWASHGRSIRPWANLDSVRPLRQAWAHDTLREVLAGRNQQKT